MFISKTRLGKEITAASQDPEAAILMGFNIERLFILTMFISAVLAGLSGVLWSQVYAANPFQILNALIYAFSIVILGGLGSVKGSIVASFIIGFIYTGVTTIYGAHMADLVALIIIIIILIIRPTGLFGVEE
jgi:branched-chain amino acid transport system permease protein